MIQVLSFPRLAWAGPSGPGLNNKSNKENQAHQQMKKTNTYSNVRLSNRNQALRAWF